MASEFIIPSFANETEEADWWYENRDLVSEEFERAGKEGRLRIGTVKKLAMAAEMGLQLSPDEVHKAADAATRRGLTFQQYINLLIHEALEKEAA